MGLLTPLKRLVVVRPSRWTGSGGSSGGDDHDDDFQVDELDRSHRNIEKRNNRRWSLIVQNEDTGDREDGHKRGAIVRTADDTEVEESYDHSDTTEHLSSCNATNSTSKSDTDIEHCCDVVMHHRQRQEQQQQQQNGQEEGRTSREAIAVPTAMAEDRSSWNFNMHKETNPSLNNVVEGDRTTHHSKRSCVSCISSEETDDDDDADGDGLNELLQSSSSTPSDPHLHDDGGDDDDEEEEDDDDEEEEKDDDDDEDVHTDEVIDQFDENGVKNGIIDSHFDKVRFGTVTVYYHDLCLGDSPSVHRGVPVALGNRRVGLDTYSSLQQYEEAHGNRPSGCGGDSYNSGPTTNTTYTKSTTTRTTCRCDHKKDTADSECPMLDSLQRVRLLKEAGYSAREIQRAAKRFERVRKERSVSRQKQISKLQHQVQKQSKKEQKQATEGRGKTQYHPPTYAAIVDDFDEIMARICRSIANATYRRGIKRHERQYLAPYIHQSKDRSCEIQKTQKVIEFFGGKVGKKTSQSHTGCLFVRHRSSSVRRRLSSTLDMIPSSSFMMMNIVNQDGSSSSTATTLSTLSSTSAPTSTAVKPRSILKQNIGNNTAANTMETVLEFS